MCRYLFIAFVLSYASAVFIDEGYNIVSIEHGLVRGRREENRYFAYLGIPYAAPPTGSNRFKAPLPPTPWDGIYEANRKVHCPQNGHGKEDCLILNVFVPENITNNLPVLVYIHGGSFIMGVGQRTGVEPLTDRGLIVVTINYRLGALGFLCLGTNDAPGNAGLKDQVAALKWVQKNIASFGGDPKRVTLYGMGAGAASVDLLVLSKDTKGLFQRAILRSGAATNCWTVGLDPIATAITVAIKHSGMTIDSLKTLANYYLKMPADVLSIINFDYFRRLTDGTYGFVPCVERRLEKVTAFMTRSPFITLYLQIYGRMPMMMIFATLEGLETLQSGIFNNYYATKMEEHFEEFLPADLTIDSNEKRIEIAKLVKHYYIANRSLSFDRIFGYLNYFGDSRILYQFLQSADAQSKNNDVYLMELAVPDNVEVIHELYKYISVARHGSVTNPLLYYKEQLAPDRVSRIIANFVKYGKPTPRPSSLLPIVWPGYNSTRPKYLRLGQALSVRDHPYWDKKLFWDDIYTRCRRRPRAPVDPATTAYKIELINEKEDRK